MFRIKQIQTTIENIIELIDSKNGTKARINLSFGASFNQFNGSFVYIWYLTMADKTIFSDCLNKINTVVETHKPLVYFSLLQKKE